MSYRYLAAGLMYLPGLMYPVGRTSILAVGLVGGLFQRGSHGRRGLLGGLAGLGGSRGGLLCLLSLLEHTAQCRAWAMTAIAAAYGSPAVSAQLGEFRAGQ